MFPACETVLIQRSIGLERSGSYVDLKSPALSPLKDPPGPFLIQLEPSSSTIRVAGGGRGRGGVSPERTKDQSFTLKVYRV